MASDRVQLLHDSRKGRPWVVRWYQGIDPETGKQRRPGESFRLKRDAERRQAELQRELDQGLRREATKDATLGELCAAYVERREKEWAPKTLAHITVLVRRLKDFFGADRKARSITYEQAADFWAKPPWLRKRNKKAEIGSWTRNRILRDARTMFRYATLWKFVDSNPFEGLKQVRVGKRARQNWRYITPEDYRTLLEQAPSLRWKVFYALAYTSGARLGELFSLTESNLDLERGRLLIRSREGTDELPPFQVKDREDREVPLPSHVVKLLRRWLRVRPKGSPLILITPQRYARIAARYRECQRTGKPFINNYLTNNLVRDIRKQAERAGLADFDRLTVHCFRKSAITNWAAHLPMHAARDFAGHSNVATTAEFYSKVCPEHEERAREIGEALIASKNSGIQTPASAASI